MFKKNSNGNFVSNKTAEENTESFSKGKTFEMNGDLYKVIEAFESDNTPMRRIRNLSYNTDEISTLVELQKDARLSKSFKEIYDNKKDEDKENNGE